MEKPCDNQPSITCDICQYGVYEEHKNYGYVCGYKDGRQADYDSVNNVDIEYEDVGQIGE